MYGYDKYVADCNYRHFSELCIMGSEDDALKYFLENSDKMTHERSMLHCICQHLSTSTIERIYDAHPNKLKLITQDNGDAILIICGIGRYCSNLKLPIKDDFESKYRFISKLYSDHRLHCVNIFTSLFVQVAKYGQLSTAKYIYENSQSFIDTKILAYEDTMKDAYKYSMEYDNYDIAEWLLSINDFDFLKMIKSACCSGRFDVVENNYDKWNGHCDINLLLFNCCSKGSYSSWSGKRRSNQNYLQLAKFLWTHSSSNQDILRKCIKIAKKYENHCVLWFMYSQLTESDKHRLKSLFSPKYFRKLCLNNEYEMAHIYSIELSDLFEVNIIHNKINKFTIKKSDKIIKYVSHYNGAGGLRISKKDL
jgi:hypothetical protein